MSLYLVLVSRFLASTSLVQFFTFTRSLFIYIF